VLAFHFFELLNKTRLEGIQDPMFLSLCFRFKAKQSKIPSNIFSKLYEIFADIEVKNKLIQELKRLEVSEEKFSDNLEKTARLREYRAHFMEVYK